MNHSRRNNYENLSIEELTDLQMHLENIKNQKMHSESPMNRLALEDERRRTLSRNEPMPLYNGSQMRYHNPYEYGPRRPILEPVHRPHINPYYRSHPPPGQPNHLRNIDAESYLLHQENPSARQRRYLNPEI